MDNFDLRKYLAEGRLLKEELTWYVEDENADIRFQNDEYLKEVGKKIKEIHPDISSEDAEIAGLGEAGLDFSFNPKKVKDTYGDASNFKLVIAGKPIYGIAYNM
jgi:hypothetical protein